MYSEGVREIRTSFFFWALLLFKRQREMVMVMVVEDKQRPGESGAQAKPRKNK